MVGISVLDSQPRSLRAFQNGVSPASCFQLDQSALVFLSNTGGRPRNLISAWCETSGKNGNLIIFSQKLNFAEWAFQKAVNTVALWVLKCSMHIASCWLLFFWVKSKNVLFSQFIFGASARRTCYSSMESFGTVRCRCIMPILFHPAIA